MMTILAAYGPTLFTLALLGFVHTMTVSRIPGLATETPEVIASEASHVAPIDRIRARTAIDAAIAAIEAGALESEATSDLEPAKQEKRMTCTPDACFLVLR